MNCLLVIITEWILLFHFVSLITLAFQDELRYWSYIFFMSIKCSNCQEITEISKCSRGPLEHSPISNIHRDILLFGYYYITTCHSSLNLFSSNRILIPTQIDIVILNLIVHDTIFLCTFQMCEIIYALKRSSTKLQISFFFYPSLTFYFPSAPVGIVL